jgi:hypothetical protein
LELFRTIAVPLGAAFSFYIQQERDMSDEIVLTPKDPRFEDLTNKTFNFLRVKSYAGRNGGRHAWNCECLFDGCGNQLIVRSNSLKTGNTKSCGCYGKSARNESNTSHGKSKTPEYAIWCAMIARCFNESNAAYKDYGKRGITVCLRWLRFENFILDMGLRPSEKHSIDRRKNENGYSPENCYWATRIEQNNNTRKNNFITHNGKTQTVSQWARELNINVQTLRQRLFILNWSTEKAFTTPAKKTVS